MSETRDLLIEIGTEELPPKALSNLSEAFSSGICRGLEQQGITYAIAEPFATPRRLAVIVKGVAVIQPDRHIEKRGPALTAAYDKNGQPTKAAQGFARSCGVEMQELETLETDKGSWLIHRSSQAGQATATLIPEMIEAALAALPIPKRMRWGNLPYEFVRPVHWVVILFGHQEIEAKILGIRSGRMTRGHRFHHPEPIELGQPADYIKLLEEKGYVFPVFSLRQEKVRLLVEEAADLIEGEAVIDPALLNEVTSLVEYPVAVTGCFDEKFLEVPAEALIAAMKGHQKYFHVLDKNGKLLPRFITLSNIASTQPHLVQAGNERVLRPRLADAAFFWNQDRAKSLESRLEQLKTVVFQNALGTLYDKSKRVAELTGSIAKQLGEDELQGIRAAQLAKCDLMTNMVGEFPELQGIMGEYYARHDGELESVAIALREHYMPRFWGDALPATHLGQALSIADKLDTLIGIFGIGQPPTGDKDPFGLRRAALSILRIMIECQLLLNLKDLLNTAQANYPAGIIAPPSSEQVFDFMLERLRGYYQDQGIPYDSIDAVLACRPVNPFDIAQRIHGVQAFRQLSAAASLASANKRIHNILKKTEETYPTQADPTYFDHAAERLLYDQMESVNAGLNQLLNNGNYTAALESLANLREPVDNFFDNVMVMADNPTIRTNRLALLHSLRGLFLQIADISKLQM